VAIPAVSRRASGRLPCCPRSCKPPYDPGQRDFPGPVLTLAVLHRPSHDRGEAQALTCIHPAHAGLPENSSPLRRQRCPVSVSGRHHGTAKRPEPLRLGSVLPPRGRHLPPSRRALPLRLRSYRLMRQTCCPPSGPLLRLPPWVLAPVASPQALAFPALGPGRRIASPRQLLLSGLTFGAAVIR